MLKELRTQHRTVIQMVFNGYRNKEIAERLEMSQTTVSQIIRSPLGQAYLEGLQDKSQKAALDVRKELVSLNTHALKTIRRILNPQEKAPHTVQLSAAKDVLDRTGYKAPDKLHVDMTMQTKTDDEIDAEIAAMEQSINKTYKQDPVKLESQDEPIAFINEQPEQKAITVDDKDMDSSDKIIPPNEMKQQRTDGVPCKDSLKSIGKSSEESISLVSKIPTNVFQN